MNAEVLDCRKVKNIAVLNAINEFVDNHMQNIYSYFDESFPHSMTDTENTAFIIDLNGKSVTLMIPVYVDERDNIIGDISLDLLLKPKNAKISKRISNDKIVSFLANSIPEENQSLNFKIITSCPGMGIMSGPIIYYTDLKNLNFEANEGRTKIYISRNKTSNVYKAHVLIHENDEGVIIKKIHF